MGGLPKRREHLDQTFDDPGISGNIEHRVGKSSHHGHKGFAEALELRARQPQRLAVGGQHPPRPHQYPSGFFHASPQKSIFWIGFFAIPIDSFPKA